MSKFKIILLVMIVLSVITKFTFGQSFTVPQNVKLKTPEDYKKYEKDVIACIDWLSSTPVNVDVDKRKKANAFLLTWISGAPNVTITLSGYVLEFTKKNPDLLMIFMGGWTKFSLENPDSTDAFKENLAGIKSVIKFYKAGNGLKKDKKMAEIIALDEKGKLEEWLKEQLAKK